jgi:hypothetical protein
MLSIVTHEEGPTAPLSTRLIRPWMSRVMCRRLP